MNVIEWVLHVRFSGNASIVAGLVDKDFEAYSLIESQSHSLNMAILGTSNFNGHFPESYDKAGLAVAA